MQDDDFHQHRACEGLKLRDIVHYCRYIRLQCMLVGYYTLDVANRVIVVETTTVWEVPY